MCPAPEENGHANGTTNGLQSNGNHDGYRAFQTNQASRPNTSNPYAPVGDFLSNVSKFKIIESTLREGE